MNVNKRKLTLAMRAEIGSLHDYVTGADGNGRPSEWERERISARISEIEDWLGRILSGNFDSEAEVLPYVAKSQTLPEN